MKEEVPASARAQYRSISGYEVSDMADIELSCKKLQLEMHAVFRPGIDTPFSPTSFNNLEMGEAGPPENTLVLDVEEGKGNPPPSTPVSERPTELLTLAISHLSRRLVSNVPEFFIGFCLSRI